MLKSASHAPLDLVALSLHSRCVPAPPAASFCACATALQRSVCAKTLGCAAGYSMPRASTFARLMPGDRRAADPCACSHFASTWAARACTVGVCVLITVVRARALAHPFQHGARLKKGTAHFLPAQQSARALCQIGTHTHTVHPHGAQHDPSYAAHHRACR